MVLHPGIRERVLRMKNILPNTTKPVCGNNYCQKRLEVKYKSKHMKNSIMFAVVLSAIFALNACKQNLLKPHNPEVLKVLLFREMQKKPN